MTPAAPLMRVAAAQLTPVLSERERNLDACEASIREAAAAGCSLLVLPECALSGYVFDDRPTALSSAEEIPGPATQRLVQACRGSNLHCVVGVLEREGDRLFNAAVLINADGVCGTYRKTHVPHLGVDRFVEAGRGPLAAHETAVGRIGIEICYEVRFPEVTRALALDGATIVAVPTNWPENAASLADFVIRTRAAENRVFVVAANRAGSEKGVGFVGRSQIIDPNGERIAELDRNAVGLVYADIDSSKATVKHLVMRPGQYEVSLFRDRRTDLYARLIDDAEE